MFATRKILIPFVILCLFFPNACNNNNRSDFSHAALQSEMSRQDFLGNTYNEIKHDELLCDFYIPKQVQQNPADVLCSNEIFFEQPNDSYEFILYQKKLKAIENLKIFSYEYKQGITSKKSIWFWLDNGATESFWSSFWKDYDSLHPNNEQAVNFFCLSGLITTIVKDGKPSLNEIISVNEQNHILSLVNSRQVFNPANSISTKDHNGNEIILCFSNNIAYYVFNNLLSYLSSNNDLINSFVYFDETGTVLSLWINSISSGMFSLPLNIAQGFDFVLPCSSGDIFVRNKFNMLVSMLPNELQYKAIKDFENLGNSYWSKWSFSYRLECDCPCEYTISFIPTDNHSGFFQFKIN